MVEFVPVTDGDLDEILDIYNYYIRNSTATFHSGKMSLEELKEFLHISNTRYPSFLIREGDETIGYCFLSQYKKRQA
ncbi:MAG: GNAT family N-acetyltransferase, partial [Methanolinea sp.]|nr:GNAT family N-acetyltransferase [Methanolinea sp.]